MEVVRGAPRWEGSTDTGLEKGCRGHCSKRSVSIQTLIDTSIRSGLEETLTSASHQLYFSFLWQTPG